jgi:glycosyltransferase involved in cell wall biosynthesis
VTQSPEVVYVLPDKVGGMMTIVDNLLRYRQPDNFRYHVVLTHNRNDADTQYGSQLPADSQASVDHELPLENLHSVVRRVHAALGAAPGVLVCNDALELILASLVDLRRTVVQILHGDYDYYYDLAMSHDPLVHAYVAYSQRVFEKLRERMPHRRDAIFHLPYGVVIPDAVRSAVNGPLRLLYVGRLDEAKGVFDLPAIDEALRLRGVAVTWTVVGNGPAADELWTRWKRSDRVRWIESATPEQVVACCAAHDVFVLSSRAEGLSVAMIEAMSAGVVPVVTNLPSLAEAIESGVTGIQVAAGDIDGFADAIARLHGDRDLLERISAAARELVIERYDIRERAAGYQNLYARWRELYRPRPSSLSISYGSRLDRPWIPNAIVRAVRSAIRSTR